MKKVGESNTHYGKIEYFEDKETGVISNQKPLTDNIELRNFLVTANPAQYSKGTEFDTLEEALNHCVILSDMVGEQYYIIELCYTDKNLPPSFIFAHENGKRIRIM